MTDNSSVLAALLLHLLFWFTAVLVFGTSPQGPELRTFTHEIVVFYRRTDGRRIRTGTACVRHGIRIIHRTPCHARAHPPANLRKPLLQRLLKRLRHRFGYDDPLEQPDKPKDFPAPPPSKTTTNHDSP